MTNRNRGLRDADPVFLWVYGILAICAYTIFPMAVFVKRSLMGWPLLTGSTWVIILWAIIGTVAGAWLIYCAVAQHREKKLSKEIKA